MCEMELCIKVKLDRSVLHARLRLPPPSQPILRERRHYIRDVVTVWVGLRPRFTRVTQKTPLHVSNVTNHAVFFGRRQPASRRGL